MLRDLFKITINCFKKVFLGYRSDNLKFDVEHLKVMFPKILYLTIEEQSYYVDFITYINVNEDWFIESVNKTLESDYNIITANTTSIGNLSYIALNCKDEITRVSALNNLKKIKEYFKK